MSIVSCSTTSTTAYKVTADTTGTLVLQTGATPTTAMTIDTSQNVGVGTSTPAAKIHSSGATASLLKLQNTGASDDNIQIQFSGSSGNRWIVGNNVASGGTGLNFQIYDWANSATRLSIDSTGAIVIGGATGSNPLQGCYFYYGTSTYLGMGHTNGTPSGNTYHNFYYNGTQIGSISQNGTTGVLYNLTSDYRLKNNQQPLTGAKEFVMALQPKTWDWWDGSGKGVGFVAHEFMEVAKYSGHGEKDAVDEEGNIIPQSIQPSSSEVMANLVAHIQNLETRLAALENK